MIGMREDGGPISEDIVQPDVVFPFTVVLLYPDYAKTEPKTYLAHVNSGNAPSAVLDAQRAAQRDNWDIEPDDFTVLHVFAGHLTDL